MMTKDQIQIVERLREAAKKHEEVADLLSVLADCLAFLNDGSNVLSGDDSDHEYLKAALLAASFAEYDAEQNRGVN